MNFKIPAILFVCLVCISHKSFAQPKVFSKKDSIKVLKEISIESKKENRFGIARLRQIEGTAIYAGKKTEVVLMEEVLGNTATNNSRQIYNKVAGLNIWESDGAGIQLGIGGRGLNPNRVSNFNTRQNGYDISADALGYPESYYTPPTEALERIEVVRGAASLQYGTQFGGFINFKFKQAPTDKVISVESRQTRSSFGFYNNFTSVSGTKNKVSYYSFYQYKKGDGWRPNSAFEVHTAHGSINYQVTNKLKINTEYTFMDYLAQQPGGLTDKQFIENPRASYRKRNWFKVNWNLMAVNLNYNFTELTRIDLRNFGLYAQRDALGFLGNINRTDPMSERNLLQDKFRNFGSELRFLHQYNFLGNLSSILIGSRYYQGLTLRKQGLGSANSDADFKYLHPDNLEHSDYKFPSKNSSVFAENIFRLGSRISITPGIRFESITTQSDGYYNEQYTDLAGNIVYSNQVKDSRTSKRHFALVGIGSSCKLFEDMELYGNFSQNYRSINFNDMRIVNPNARVDNNLKDEKGYSADLGFRGTLKNYLSFDASIFYLKYNDRIGSILLVDSFTYLPYRLRTNIADSRNIGLESFVEIDLYKLFNGKNDKIGLSIFGNISLIDAKYLKSKEANYENKKVEFVPRSILRTGLSVNYATFKFSLQFSKTSEQYTDASNSIYSANAITGLIPSYYIADLALSYTYKRLIVSSGINNLNNNMYFTRRADGYPGPGIIPSDGRSYYLTVGIKI
jgi:Fe(3+) dicitrate transport protein